MKTFKERFTALHALAALCLAITPLGGARAANLGIIHGTVRDQEGVPIAGVRVTLFARGNRLVDQHITDKDGHFDFEQVQFGQYRVVSKAPDGRTDEQLVEIASGDVLTMDVVMPGPRQGEEEVVVVAPRPHAPRPPTTASSSSKLDHADIQSLPRGDTASVNEVLATQPGFVYDAFGNLFARGNHANIQYQLDGVPLPDSVSGLFGGFLSAKFIENMELITGGLPAEYGERLAAVVNLNTRHPSPDGEGEAEIVYGAYQTFSPSAFYGRQFGALSVLAGASYKGTNRALDPQAFSPILHDAGHEERGFLKLDYDFSDQNHLSLLGTFARNRYQIPIDPFSEPLDPNHPNATRLPDAYGNPPPPFFPRDTNQTQTERDFLALVSYRHNFNPRSSLRTSAYYRGSNGIFFGDPTHALGPTQDPCSTDDTGQVTCASTSDVTRRANHIGVDTEYLLGIGESHVLKFGGKVDQLFGSTDYTSYTRSDSLLGPDPDLTVSGSDQAHATSGGVFAQDRLTFGKFVVNAGLRFDFQKVSFTGTPDQATHTGLEPRLGIAYAFTPNVVPHAFFGLLWMPPPVLDTPAAARQLGVLPADQVVTYDLRPEKDRYAEIGISARVLPELTLGLNVWGKLSTDQLDDIEVGSTNVLSPYNFRDGRAGGVEVSAVFVLSRQFSAFGNATLQSAQGRGIASATYLFSPDALANNNWQTLDHSQTWTANTGATYHFFRTTQLSGLLAYGSGLRTGPANNQHVPDHVRIDASLGHEFRDWPLRPKLTLDVVNVLNSQYAYRIANGFNGSHWAPGRSAFVRLTTSF